MVPFQYFFSQSSTCEGFLPRLDVAATISDPKSLSLDVLKRCNCLENLFGPTMTIPEMFSSIFEKTVITFEVLRCVVALKVKENSNLRPKQCWFIDEQYQSSFSEFCFVYVLMLKLNQIASNCRPNNSTLLVVTPW